VPVEVSYTLVENGANGDGEWSATEDREAYAHLIRTKARAPILRWKRWRNSSPRFTRMAGDGRKQFADERRRGRRPW
jgi:hypothetical protein